MERCIDRRAFGRLALGSVATLAGISSGKESTKYKTESLDLSQMSSLERMQQIKNGLDDLQPKFESNVLVDGPQDYRLIVPNLARGEMVVPTKKEVIKETKFIARKPEYTYEQIWGLTKTLRGTHEPLRVIETDYPLVAITVDDGFDKEAIKMILSIAKKKGITYTDFMKGEQRRQYPDMVEALVESEIVEFGNHTETHRDQRNAPVPIGSPNRRPTWDEFKDDLYIAENYLVDNFGQTTLPYLRPPGGAADEYTTDWNAQLGFLPLNWYANIEDMPLNVPKGAIILAHYRQATVNVFERWVDGMLSQGFYPTAVSNVIAHANDKFLSRLKAV